MYNYAETWAKLIRSLIDFQSSTSSSRDKPDTPSLKTSTAMELYQGDMLDEESPYGKLVSSVVLAAQPSLLRLFGVALDSLEVRQRIWGFYDYLDFFLGLIDGSFGALPQGTAAQQCSVHNINARKHLKTATTKFNAKQEKDGMTALHDFMNLIDDLGNTCYYGVETYVALDYSTFISGGGVLENLLYNAGFMFTDVVEIVLNNDTTVT